MARTWWSQVLDFIILIMLITLQLRSSSNVLRKNKDEESIAQYVTVSLNIGFYVYFDE